MPLPDAIVVGAGIVGAACAEALARDGLVVDLLDAKPPGGGATAAGMGHIVVMDDSEAQFSLTHYSRTLWRSRADEFGDGVEWRETGTIWVASDEEELVEAKSKKAYYESRGARATDLDEKELTDAEPNLRKGLTGGLLVPDDAVLYPPAAAKWLADLAGARRGRVLVGNSVRSVGEGFVVLENGERLEAGLVVVAAGVDALALLDEPLEGLQIRPRKGHLVITDRYPEFCHHQLVELGYLKSAHGDSASSVAFNLQPRATGQLLLGSSRQFDSETDEVDRDLVTRMIDRAFNYMPSISKLSVIRIWTGFRAATGDNLPIIGRHSTMPNVWLAAGQEGLGITTSLATGQIVADLVAGRQTAIDPSPFSPGRGIGGADA